jgi:tetratricopeptide (TPR) repeat protein
MSETGEPSASHLTTAQLLQQGLFHHQRGELALAVERYSEVLRTDPQNADALYYCAVVACQEDQLEQGIGLARRALERGPPQARIHNLLGKALDRQGKTLDAVKSFDAAIALDANFAEAHGNRAGILAASGFTDQALAGFERALALDPKAVADWINRGVLLQELGRDAEAIEGYDKALAIAPDNATVLMNRANALARLGRYAEAEAGFDAVIKRAPKLQLAYTHKALSVMQQGRLDEARALLDQAHKMNEKDAETAVALARLMLLTGDWRAGLALFEARAGLARPPFRPLDFPRWRGQRPEDFRLVVLCEQDLGDTIQFSRYAALLARRGHDVTLLTPPVLAPLMRTLPDIEMAVSDDAEFSGDKRRIEWLPLMSTIGALHLTPDTVPVEAPYLGADPQRAALWAERLGSRGFKVGIVWRGTTGEGSAPLAALAPLAAIPGLRLIALQGRPGEAEIDAAPFVATLENPLGSGAMDADRLLDTAAIVTHLDAVVSVDSWPAHLAGALGKPVLLALARVPDWRWLLSRDDTPWYPTMRLYRQRAAGEWAEVFEAIARDLRARSATLASQG